MAWGCHELKGEWLLDKGGFYDGDIFDVEANLIWEEQKRQGVPYTDRLLSKSVEGVVRKYLVPAIPFDVKIEVFATPHNGCVIVEFDGQEIDETNHHTIKALLESVRVTVTHEQVMEVLAEITGMQVAA